MPIMSAHGRNDARAAARLLATKAIECLDNPTMAPDHSIVLNNVYRLLEAYRVNTFFGLQRTMSYPAPDALSSTPPLEQHVREVREILERAVENTFAGHSKNEAILSIENVLKRIAYPEFGAVAEADRQNASRFFMEVVQQLQRA